MKCREPLTTNVDDCCSCSSNFKGFNAKNKSIIIYRNMSSTTRPIPPGREIPILPQFLLFCTTAVKKLKPYKIPFLSGRLSVNTFSHSYQIC